MPSAFNLALPTPHPPRSTLTFAALMVSEGMSPPKLQLVTPPGGASTREEGRSVMKLLQGRAGQAGRGWGDRDSSSSRVTQCEFKYVCV